MFINRSVSTAHTITLLLQTRLCARSVYVNTCELLWCSFWIHGDFLHRDSWRHFSQLNSYFNIFNFFFGPQQNNPRPKRCTWGFVCFIEEHAQNVHRFFYFLWWSNKLLAVRMKPARGKADPKTSGSKIAKFRFRLWLMWNKRLFKKRCYIIKQ